MRVLSWVPLEARARRDAEIVRIKSLREVGERFWEVEIFNVAVAPGAAHDETPRLARLSRCFIGWMKSSPLTVGGRRDSFEGQEIDSWMHVNPTSCRVGKATG
jgi:hypothetical protein